jgi:hypothetical protein
VPRSLSEEETVKRLGGLVMVAFLVLAPTASAAAQPAAPAGGWTWSGVLDAILGWTDGAWSAVAGSETGGDEESEETPTGVVPPPGEGDTSLMTVGTGSGEECESYPKIDPDG